MINNKKKINIINIKKNNIYNQRLDNFLSSIIKNKPKNTFYKKIRIGAITVNKKKKKPKYRLKIEDKIYIPSHYITKKKHYTISENERKHILSTIIYNSNKIMAINKPSGIPVHGGTGIKTGGIIEKIRIIFNNEPFLELIHRLDKETSGILLIAKKPSILQFLHEQLRLKKIKKYYLALVKGNLKQQIKINTPLLKTNNKNKNQITIVNKKGKKSQTIFKKQENFSKLATLVKIIPITGRTHQIRAHAQHINHPIAQDKIYGDKQFNKKTKNWGLNRLFLHAIKIKFKIPNKKNKICITAPLDQKLKKLIIKMRKNTNL